MLSYSKTKNSKFKIQNLKKCTEHILVESYDSHTKNNN